jgi:hypothetical protein
LTSGLEDNIRYWRLAAFAAGLIATLGVGAALQRVPLEVSEVVGNLLYFQTAPPAGQIMAETFAGPSGPKGVLRNFSFATGKFLFDVSGGRYLIVYRSFHTALVLILLLSLVHLVKVDSRATFGVAMLASVALVGGHTFHEAVRETETNIKLIVPAMLMASLVLAASPPAWWKDAVAVVASFFAFFSNELGLLLWVLFVVAYLVGFRGVSWKGLVALTLLLLAYFFLRFVIWEVGSLGLNERSSGFGFYRYDPAELNARFGANPYPLYAYNVLAQWLTVFFVEPRSGAFVVTRGVLDGNPQWGSLLEVVTSTLTTAVMGWYVAVRLGSWWRLQFDHWDRLFLVSMAIASANAVISFPYAKEVTMSAGSVFYALAIFPAFRAWLSADRASVSLARAVLVYGLVVCISVGWAARGFSFFVDMRRSAYRAQNAWVDVYGWMAEQNIPASDQGRLMIDGLRREALQMEIPRLYHESEWLALLDPVH